MNESVEKALRVLHGSPLRRIGRAADMLWLQFGAWREVPARRGGVRRVGDWALHVQTAWRFTRGARILVGNRDLYYYAESSGDFAESGRDFDWDKDGESRFDQGAAALNREFEISSPCVTRIDCDAVGGMSLMLGPDLSFAVFPSCASDAPDVEFWRLLQPATEAPHFVVETRRSGSG